MAFLILTERGLEDLKASAARLSSALYINQGVLSDEEIGQLRSEGMDVVALSRHIDPYSPAEVEQAVREIRQRYDEPVWVERGMPGPGALALRSRPSGKGARNFLRALEGVGGRAGALSARALRHLKHFRASDGPPVVIVPYMGFGTSGRFMLQGRVLKDEGFAAPAESDSPWGNFIELYKRLGSDEVPGARLLARFEGAEQEIVTDAGGYFNAEIIPPRPLASSGWHTVELELIDPAPPAGKPIRAAAQVLVPPASARFGVISDIDDTVLWSNVSNKLKMLLMLAVSNAHTRKPFKGVTAFYCALRDGIGGDEGNPIFYVSSSPWHLYTPLVDFFQTQGIPLGPILLKELGVRTLFGAGRHHGHKLESIERILQTYPQLPFILIGDSGQQDPEIYKEIVQRHPQRIRVIYIRNVDPDPARIEAIDRLIDEVRAAGAQLLLVPDSEFAATHAAAEGLINAGDLGGIRSAKRNDERAANPDI